MVTTKAPLAIAVAVCCILVGCSRKLRVDQQPRIDQLLDQLVVSGRLPDMAALNELVKMGKPALPLTVQKLGQESDPRKQQLYLMLLCHIGDASVASAVVPYAHSAEGNVREWSAFCLGIFGDKDSIGAMVGLLSDRAVEDEAKQNLADRLRALTGQKIGFSESMPHKKKVEAIQAWADWWAKTRPRQKSPAGD